MTACKGRVLEHREEVERALATGPPAGSHACAGRRAAARAILPADWVRRLASAMVLLIANFPVDGLSRIVLSARRMRRRTLTIVKAQVSWIIARQDRAWYAVRQREANVSTISLVGRPGLLARRNWDEFTPAEQALL